MYITKLLFPLFIVFFGLTLTTCGNKGTGDQSSQNQTEAPGGKGRNGKDKNNKTSNKNNKSLADVLKLPTSELLETFLQYVGVQENAFTDIHTIFQNEKEDVLSKDKKAAFAKIFEKEKEILLTEKELFTTIRTISKNGIKSDNQVYRLMIIFKKLIDTVEGMTSMYNKLGVKMSDDDMLDREIRGDHPTSLNTTMLTQYQEKVKSTKAALEEMKEELKKVTGDVPLSKQEKEVIRPKKGDSLYISIATKIKGHGGYRIFPSHPKKIAGHLSSLANNIHIIYDLKSWIREWADVTKDPLVTKKDKEFLSDDMRMIVLE